MTSQEILAENGNVLLVWGQAERSSSTTVGHPEAMMARLRILAETGDYEYATLQRAWRTATNREGTSRLMPDIIGVRKNGMVDAWEVRSNSDTKLVLRLRLEEGMSTLPEARQGDIDVIIIP